MFDEEWSQRQRQSLNIPLLAEYKQEQKLQTDCLATLSKSKAVILRYNGYLAQLKLEIQEHLGKHMEGKKPFHTSLSFDRRYNIEKLAEEVAQTPQPKSFKKSQLRVLQGQVTLVGEEINRLRTINADLEKQLSQLSSQKKTILSLLAKLTMAVSESPEFLDNRPSPSP